MPKSMTGYGRGESEAGGRKFVVEIKSVNHRYNDISIKIPRTMLSFEEPLRKKFAGKIFRGKTDVFVNFESISKDDVELSLNEALADKLVEELDKIKGRYNLEQEVGLSLIARFPDVINVSKELDEKDLSPEGQLWQVLEQAASKALEQFLAMRSKEGEFLQLDILKKISAIEERIVGITERAPLVVDEYRQKMTQRMKNFLEGQVDEARILTEAAIFADKCSIDEELTRFKSHIAQMRLFLEEKDAIGRKLDFLVQEMNREANTISSKSNDVQITSHAVLLKNEIEKIREQVQNIE